MVRQRRKCLYRGCGHNQGNNTHNCTFLRFPKDPAGARSWLTLGGVYDQTPKRLLSHWCFCSCHFPAGRKGNPVEFIEDYEVCTVGRIYQSLGKRQILTYTLMKHFCVGTRILFSLMWSHQALVNLLWLNHEE